MGAKVNWNKEPKAYKDPDYLQWVHNTQKCLVCGSGNIEAHHIKHHSIKGRDDRYIIPLCPFCHRGSTLSPHGTPKAFKERYPIAAQVQLAYQMYEKYANTLETPIK